MLLIYFEILPINSLKMLAISQTTVTMIQLNNSKSFSVDFKIDLSSKKL